MKKPLIALSIVCASALALADIEQWQSNWFAGIGTGVTSIFDLNPKNGSWSALTEGTAEITTDGALELDLDSGTEATFTVTEGTAEDTETLQRLTVTGVFTPIAADELLTDTGMAEKGAQVGFAVVSETTETTSDADDTTPSTTAYKYYAWVGAASTEVSASSKVGWVALGAAPSADATTELTIDLAYWTDEVTATFTIKANGETISLTKSQLTLTGGAKTAANKKTIASVSCTGSGKLTAVNGEVQLGVASVGGRKYGTVDEAIDAAAAAGKDESVSVSRVPNGVMEKNTGTVTLEPADSSKEFVYNADRTEITAIQTSTEILNNVKFLDKTLMSSSANFRTFLSTYCKTSYEAAGATAPAITAELSEKGANNLPLWQSYALGIDPAASVKPKLAEADKTDKENIILTIPALVSSANSGDFTITYKVGNNVVTDLSAIKIPMTETTQYPITISFE